VTARPPWSTPATIEQALRRRWASGELLRAHAGRQPFTPVQVPLRGPTPGELADDLDRVRRWADDLQRGARRAGGTAYHLQTRTLGGRAVGRNEVPARAVIDELDQAWRLLGVRADVAAYDALRAATRAVAPAVAPWLEDHPMRALPHAADWTRILAAVAWLRDHTGQGRYLRQIEAPGVDTKFIERHRPILAELLEAVEPSPVVDAGRSRGQEFALRYGFAMPQPLVRLRPGPGTLPVRPPVREIGLHVDELAALTVSLCRVVVVENEVTYLSITPEPETMIVFGSGFTVASLGAVGWLADCDVHYWGDLDTHGFAILDRLRAWLPQVRSLLMDRDTLLVHRDRWVHESKPTRARLERLTRPEADLYRDLVEDVFGEAVRLEQERIAWPHVEAALAALRPG
jgi:hypothetical protein